MLRIARAGAAVTVLFVASTRASAETTLCTVISTLPYTIAAQGNYCLDRNLSTAITTGNAITINSDFVLLDLNGFKIGGGSGGFGTQANGVFAENRKNVTVKNGNIRGFLRGVYLKDSSGSTYASQGHLVEDVRADENTHAGIWVEGRGHLVRNNLVVSTGKTTVGSVVEIVSIAVVGPGSRVLNNDVTDTLGRVAGGGLGAAPGLGVLVRTADSTVVERNRIGNETLAATSTGILADMSSDVQVIDNRLATFGAGVLYASGSDGKYRDNVTTGVSTSFSGGTDAGNNN